MLRFILSLLLIFFSFHNDYSQSSEPSYEIVPSFPDEKEKNLPPHISQISIKEKIDILPIISESENRTKSSSDVVLEKSKEASETTCVKPSDITNLESFLKEGKMIFESTYSKEDKQKELEELIHRYSQKIDPSSLKVIGLMVNDLDSFMNKTTDIIFKEDKVNQSIVPKQRELDQLINEYSKKMNPDFFLALRSVFDREFSSALKMVAALQLDPDIKLALSKYRESTKEFYETSNGLSWTSRLKDLSLKNIEALDEILSAIKKSKTLDTANKRELSEIFNSNKEKTQTNREELVGNSNAHLYQFMVGTRMAGDLALMYYGGTAIKTLIDTPVKMAQASSPKWMPFIQKMISSGLNSAIFLAALEDFKKAVVTPLVCAVLSPKGFNKSLIEEVDKTISKEYGKDQAKLALISLLSGGVVGPLVAGNAGPLVSLTTKGLLGGMLANGAVNSGKEAYTEMSEAISDRKEALKVKESDPQKYVELIERSNHEFAKGGEAALIDLPVQGLGAYSLIKSAYTGTKEYITQKKTIAELPKTIESAEKTIKTFPPEKVEEAEKAITTLGSIKNPTINENQNSLSTKTLEILKDVVTKDFINTNLRKGVNSEAIKNLQIEALDSYIKYGRANLNWEGTKINTKYKEIYNNPKTPDHLKTWIKDILWIDNWRPVYDGINTKEISEIKKYSPKNPNEYKKMEEFGYKKIETGKDYISYGDENSILNLPNEKPSYGRILELRDSIIRDRFLTKQDLSLISKGESLEGKPIKALLDHVESLKTKLLSAKSNRNKINILKEFGNLNFKSRIATSDSEKVNILLNNVTTTLNKTLKETSNIKVQTEAMNSLLSFLRTNSYNYKIELLNTDWSSPLKQIAFDKSLNTKIQEKAYKELVQNHQELMIPNPPTPAPSLNRLGRKRAQHQKNIVSTIKNCKTVAQVTKFLSKLGFQSTEERYPDGRVLVELKRTKGDTQISLNKMRSLSPDDLEDIALYVKYGGWMSLP